MQPASIIKILIDTRIRLIVWLVLLAMLAYQLAIVFWQFYPEPVVQNTVQIEPLGRSGVDGAGQQTSLDKANAIARSYLFGKAEQEQVVVQNVEQAPETKLNYKLRGIYFSDEAALSSAIVEVRPNDSKHYYIGDELDDKIILSAIAQDHVLIDRYGKIERLNLQKPVVSSSSNDVASIGLASSPDTTRLLQSYKRRYVSNPLALAKRFQAIPVQENGRNVGFRLRALRGESLLKKLDFNENDVFTKINGISLDKPFQALDALKSLTTAKSVSVTILRNGNEQTMEFNL